MRPQDDAERGVPARAGLFGVALGDGYGLGEAHVLLGRDADAGEPELRRLWQLRHVVRQAGQSVALAAAEVAAAAIVAMAPDREQIAPAARRRAQRQPLTLEALRPRVAGAAAEPQARTRCRRELGDDVLQQAIVRRLLSPARQQGKAAARVAGERGGRQARRRGRGHGWSPFAVMVACVMAPVLCAARGGRSYARFPYPSDEEGTARRAGAEVGSGPAQSRDHAVRLSARHRGVFQRRAALSTEASSRPKHSVSASSSRGVVLLPGGVRRRSRAWEVRSSPARERRARLRFMTPHESALR
ncbi:hypothetical protein DW352_12605 [Pseudolabrys taiwanensis]|uniref:Uncharacterized protein n=1 Tax=Pseudolabrys taiwanensis TaxID=331696 RepID=A0A345ZWI2_9HYPH|nr:hypothetical protein DW352_12605 [Pseudolabrys taiwanensis]